jgi:hypothetical protein
VLREPQTTLSCERWVTLSCQQGKCHLTATATGMDLDSGSSLARNILCTNLFGNQELARGDL